MRTLLMAPLLLGALILQTSILNELQVLSGFANLTLLILVSWSLNSADRYHLYWAVFATLFFSYISAIPPMIPLVVFVGSAYLARKVARGTWQVPVIALMFSILIASLIDGAVTILYLWFQSGFGLDILTMAGSVFLPSTLLNMLVAIPVNSVMRDFAMWATPQADEL